MTTRQPPARICHHLEQPGEQPSIEIRDDLADDLDLDALATQCAHPRDGLSRRNR